jgi:formylglycine-generating enzyme required for sulfatase activity
LQNSGNRILGGAALALWLVACSPPSQPAQREDVAVISATPAVAAQPVEIAPADAAAVVHKVPAPLSALHWQPPAVDLRGERLSVTRRRAAQALQQDRLYDGPDTAIPLYLAIRQATANKDREARAGLRKARLRLLAQVRQGLREGGEQLEALEHARMAMMVVLTLAPDDEQVHSLLRQVEVAQRVFNLNRAGEESLYAGRLGVDGVSGALADFRAALQLQPDQARARQGLAAVESAVLRRAEDALAVSDFAAAQGWLEVADKVRENSLTVADARQRIAAIREARVAAIHDAALRELTSPKGLKAAAEKLAEAERIALPGDTMVADLQQRLRLATHYGSFRPGQVFTDSMLNGSRGPQMVVVPHGRFRMGASVDEPGSSDAERPAHEVNFERGFAMSIAEVTVAEFGQFVQQSGRRARATRRGHSLVYDERSGNFVRRNGVDWRSGYDGAAALPNSPVMHVSVRDAEAYAVWLTQQTGRQYRLPSEAEFEYALRAGSSGRYPWGDDGTPPAGVGNLTGGNDVSPGGRHWSNAFIGYGDGHWGPAVVASFRGNAWGLHDMAGNLSEWVADCWHASYRRAPADGAAWFNPGCRQRVVRGGNWANSPEQSRAAWRLMQDSDITGARIGFRLVRGI